MIPVFLINRRRISLRQLSAQVQGSQGQFLFRHVSRSSVSMHHLT
ncbi:UNVERIFIED_CONTAM: hypothetical protein GTU68_055704 [Idotea baltica]|nr:hypothetical protein [Idotea baltica]